MTTICRLSDDERDRDAAIDRFNDGALDALRGREPVSKDATTSRATPN